MEGKRALTVSPSTFMPTLTFSRNDLSVPSIA